jgi:hypothetical protein
MMGLFALLRMRGLGDALILSCFRHDLASDANWN